MNIDNVLSGKEEKEELSIKENNLRLYFFWIVKNIPLLYFIGYTLHNMIINKYCHFYWIMRAYI